MTETEKLIEFINLSDVTNNLQMKPEAINLCCFLPLRRKAHERSAFFLQEFNWNYAKHYNNYYKEFTSWLVQKRRFPKWYYVNERRNFFCIFDYSSFKVLSLTPPISSKLESAAWFLFSFISLYDEPFVRICYMLFFKQNLTWIKMGLRDPTLKFS